MLHLDEGTIHSWLDGELSDAERARVERHVAECQQCAAAVAEARGMIAGAARIVSALDSVPGGVIPKAPPVARRSRSLWRTLGVTPARAAFAATLLIAVAATLAKRHDRTNAIPFNQPLRTVISTPASAAPPIAAPKTTPRVARPIGGRPADAAAAPYVPPAVLHTRAKSAAEPRVLREPTPITSAPAAAAPAAVSAPVNALERPVSQPPTAQGTASGVAAEAKRTTAQLVAGSAGVSDTTTNRNAGVAGGKAQSLRRLPLGATRMDQVVVTSSVVQTGFAGCYRVTSDSLIRAGIPPRFALQVATLERDTAQNIVRLVAPDGRIDSALAGGTWRELSPRVANVSFAVGATRTLRLELSPSGAIAGKVEEALRPGGIVRASCQP